MLSPRFTKLLLWICLGCSPSVAFGPSFLVPARGSETIGSNARTSVILREYSDDSGPSDYDTSEVLPEQKEVMVDDKEEDALIRDALKRELLLLASVTNRGEYASSDERDILIDLVSQLEALNPTAQPASNCEGDWDLCLSSTQFFRSSPFFQAIRIAMGDPQMAENGFDLHDRATSMSRMGRVRQSIREKQLVSEVDLEVGLMPGIPVKVKGTVVTSAKLAVVSDQKWELQVQNTKVKGSNIPIFNQILEDNLQIELPVGDFYSTLQGSVPIIPMTVRSCLVGRRRYFVCRALHQLTPFPSLLLQTLYVDESMRITRDIDDNFFVFTRA